MPFEIYRPHERGESSDKDPLVSLSKNSIVFNKKCRELLNSPEFLEIAYNKKENILRIKPSDKGLKLKKTKIMGRGLFNFFNIEKKGKFKITFNQEQNAIFVDLNQMPV